MREASSTLIGFVELKPSSGSGHLGDHSDATLWQTLTRLGATGEGRGDLEPAPECCGDCADERSPPRLKSSRYQAVSLEMSLPDASTSSAGGSPSASALSEDSAAGHFQSFSGPADYVSNGTPAHLEADMQGLLRELACAAQCLTDRIAQRRGAT